MFHHLWRQADIFTAPNSKTQLNEMEDKNSIWGVITKGQVTPFNLLE
jgi:hypothetical protein